MRAAPLCAAILVLSAAWPWAQQPVRDARPEIVGTASVSGMVVAADAAKAPLRRARVTITGGSLVSPRVTVTGDDGRFIMNGLAPGYYSISADKPGYLKMNYGATRPSRQGTVVVAADGQQVAGLVIAMPRGSVIAGTVTNAGGEPEPDVWVTALYWQLRNGERTLVPIGQATTDDRGEYRVAGLNAGDYLVSVEPPDSSRGPADLIQIPEGAVDRALQGIQQMAGGGTASAAPTRARSIGPAPVFYPGTVRPAGAATVTLGTGEERGGIDIRTELVPMSKITGTVSGDGQAMSGVQVTLVPLGPPAPNFVYAIGGRLGPKRTDTTGQFAFVGVPPGEYRVQASTRVSGGGSAGPPPDAHPRMAFAEVDPDGDDRTVDLALRPGMSMSGRVAFDGAPAPAALTGTRVTLEGLRISPGYQVDRFTADAESDGTFEVAGLAPGRFLITVAPPGGPSATDWAVKSMTTGGRDLLDAPFELTPGEILSDVVVTFTARPSEISGTLQNSSGTPTANYFIVVFTTNRAFWFPNSRRITSVRPNTAGAYTVRNLPPGEYFISVVTDVEIGEWFDPAFLQSLVAASPLSITIGEGEKKTQHLRIGG